jgi:hypothetical protein
MAGSSRVMAGSDRVMAGSDRVILGSKPAVNPNVGKDRLECGGFVCVKKVLGAEWRDDAFFGSFDGIKASLRSTLCTADGGENSGNRDKGFVLLEKML